MSTTCGRVGPLRAVRPMICGMVLVLTACGDDPTGAIAKVPTCEPGASSARLLPLAEATATRTAGGYPTELLVDPSAPRSDGVTFRRITDALDAARKARQGGSAIAGAGCRITIKVLPGTFVGTTASTSDSTRERLPLLIDVPDITLQGSYTMSLDSAGRPAGAAPASAGTTLTADPPLEVVGGTTQTGVSEPLVIVNAENGEGGNGVIIQGFVFRSGHAANDAAIAGKGILALRTEGLVVRDNSFEGHFTERIDLREGSAVVERNFSTGPGDTCDICIAGPGQFLVRSNKLEQGGIPGVLIVPATVLPVPSGIAQTVPPAAATVNVEVVDNEVRAHERTPVGTGLRVAAVGINAPNVAGTSVVTMRGNYVHDNRFGLIVEAGFPVAGSRLRGDVILETSDNRIVGSCQADLLVSLSRHTTGLGLANAPYLRDSHYMLTLGSDLPWSEAWYASVDGTGNTLEVNGAEVPAGRRTAYVGTRVCS